MAARLAAAISLLFLLPDEVSDLVEKLRKAQSVDRYRIQNDITTKATRAHVPMLVAEIAKGPQIIRPYLIRCLRPLDAKAELKKLCVQHDYMSRAEAAYMLKLLGDASGLELLLDALPKATKAEEKRAILYKLYSYYIKGPKVVETLKKFLEEEKDDSLRRIAINTLVSHKDKSATELLKKIAADEKDSVQYEALAALIRLGDVDALEQALKALEAGTVSSTGLTYVMSAIQTLGEKSVLPRLRKVLEKTEDKNVKIQILRVLSWLKDKKALPQIAKLAEDEDQTIADAATDALMKMAGRSHIDIIKKLLKHENATRRLAAAEALLNLDDLSGYEVLEAELKSDTWSYRRQAVQILGKYRHPKSITLIISALKDPEAQVSAEARRTLVTSLEAMYPYLKFDSGAAPADIEKWWSENKPK